MLRSSLTALILALLFGAGAAIAAPDSPNDPNQGGGNDGSTHEGPGTGGGHPGGSGPGQSLFDVPAEFVIAGGNGTEDPPGTPSGPQGPGQHGQSGPDGNSGP